MARYQVILAYDGTAFNGMQRQLEARTVQGVVEEALMKIGWQGRSILVAGRTDAGVHASGQVIAFDLDWAHSPQDLQNALNATLPMDVAVQQAAPAKADFHPRYDAHSRSYRYQIFCQDQRDPLRERYAWRVWPPLDLARLQAAVQHLVGEHDFAAYGTPPKEDGPTVREVFAAGWVQAGDSFTFEVNANAYLYHMVRRMVSLMAEIGQGRQEPEFVSETLSGKPEDMIQGLAPPHGLFLTEVRYAELEQ
jgi:tRNA pseudouridine38-40 synthase